jgi:DNA polymerase III delta prime subunit
VSTPLLGHEADAHPPTHAARKRDGKPSKDRPLLRPIICICNDLYASALAKLRPHARIVRFNRPADIAVVKRLRTICEEQSLRADSRALTTLVGVTRGDLRGCLNTLQVRCLPRPSSPALTSGSSSRPRTWRSRKP